MTINQIINWVIGLDTTILAIIGFFLVIGFLFLVTAIYSLVYDKSFRKKYILKLSTIFFILLSAVISIFYLAVKYGALSL